MDFTRSRSAWDYATPLAQSAWDNYQKQWRIYGEKSLEILCDYTGRAQAAGVNSEFLQRTNEPGKGICQAAKSWQADLIVMGSHQRKGFQELLLGSVSNYVMHHAPCSVMVVALEPEQSESTEAVVEDYQVA
ncbi:MAG: universal stress protein [Phormidesmis sp. RL_2_1]|nr:universal stress protein [Phormidesmis sp. RL_2_1]